MEVVFFSVGVNGSRYSATYGSERCFDRPRGTIVATRLPKWRWGCRRGRPGGFRSWRSRAVTIGILTIDSRQAALASLQFGDRKG